LVLVYVRTSVLDMLQVSHANVSKLDNKFFDVADIIFRCLQNSSSMLYAHVVVSQTLNFNVADVEFRCCSM
jgi:hypothetical protein